MRFYALLSFVAVFVAALTPGLAHAQFDTWELYVPESEFLNVSGRSDMDSAEVGGNGAGLFVAVDVDDGLAESILLIDESLADGSEAVEVADANDIKTAVDAMNGTAADYVAGDVLVQNAQFNADGRIIVYCDDGTNAAALLAIEPTSPFTINVLSTAVDAAPSPVEGGVGMFLVGNTAYLLIEGDFGGAEDQILSVDTGTIVSDGSAPVSVVIGEADLLAATGQTATDYRHNDGCGISPTELLVINSGRAASSDDVLKVTLGSPNTVALHIDATEIESELGTSDVGFSAIAYDSFYDNIWLANAFGAGASDDGIVIVDTVNSATDVSLSLDSEAKISGDVGGSSLFLGSSCLAYDFGNNAMILFSGGGGTEGLLRKVLGPVAPELTVVPTSLAFGQQDIAAGATGAQSVTITNDGNSTLNFTGPGIALTGTDPGDFAIANSPATTPLAPGASVVVDVVFDPASTGVKSAALTITTDDADEGTFDVSLAGEGTTVPTAPEITVTPASLDFGQQNIGDGPTALQTVTITNDGDALLNFTGAGIALTGADAAEFAFATPPTTTSLAPTASIDVDIVFDPSSTGVKAAALTITTDDADEPTVNVTLAGEGTTPPPAPEITVLPASLDFGQQDVGMGPTTTQTVTITNDGTADLTFTGAGIEITGADGADFAIVNSPSTSPLIPTASLQVQIAFDPTLIGVKAAALTITTDDADEPTVNVTLAGEGIPAFQTWDLFVPESEFLAVSGRADMDSAELGGNGNGLFVAVDVDDSAGESIVLIDPSLPDGSEGVELIDAAGIKAAIDAMNGSAADYDAAEVAIQEVLFNADGNVVVYCDDDVNDAALLVLELTSPTTVNVLSATVDATPSPVEGGVGMFMIGNTALMLTESDFGAPADQVIAIDTSVLVNDGSAPVGLAIGEADLLAAAGDIADDYRHSEGIAISQTEFLLVNSGRASSNDNIIKVTIGEPSTAELYIDATEIEADTGGTDVGFSAIAVDVRGRIWLANAFGSSGVDPDDGIIIIEKVDSPTSVALTVDTEGKIAGDVGGSSLFLGSSCLSYDAAYDSMILFSGGTDTEGLLRKRLGPIDPEINSTPASVDFGQQIVDNGPTPLQNVTLRNEGTTFLAFNGVGIEITGGDAADFAIVNTPSTGLLAPTGTVLVQITFDPGTTGTKSAALTVTTNDADEPVYTIPLSGEGIPTPAAAQFWHLMN